MFKSSLSHIAINCKDPLLIEAFYTKYFGFIRTRVYAPGPDQVVMIKCENVYFELFKATEESPLPLARESGILYPGIRHICFQVEDLDLVLKELGDSVQLTLGPLDMGQFIPGMRVCWVADPEGNIVEINQGYVDEENPPKFQ
jgi:glyoxylase I family protein